MDRDDRTPSENESPRRDSGRPEKRRRARRPSGVKFDRKHSSSGGRLWWFIALLVIIVAVLAWLNFRPVEDSSQPLTLGRPAADLEAGDRAVVLVFPSWDGTDYVSEERQVPSRDRVEEDLLTVMYALCEGPRDGGSICAIPEGTRPLGAFFDEVKGSAVIDFSRELVTGHPGGSAAESATLTSILRTLALNFPEIRSCHLLVDGGQSMTLAGHLMLDRAFVPRRWL